MKPELPESVRRALARQTVADGHPSTDLLNGFVERELSDAEQKLVALHLAACADCRDVVFLASAATSAAAEEDRQVAAVAAAGYEPHAAKATWRWTSWKWAAPALAMVVIVAVVVVERRKPAESHPATNETLALSLSSSTPAMQAGKPAPEQETAPATPAQSAERKATPARRPKSSDRQAQQERAQTIQREEAASMSESLALPTSQQPVPPAAAAGGVIEGPVGGATSSTRTRSSASVSDSLPKRSAAPGVMAKAGKPAALSGLVQSGPSGGNDLTYIPTAQKASLPPTWRITDDGQLEHATSSGAWARALADQPVSFHAVAVVGNDVWAGGSNGALFHSADAGKHWMKVDLTADGQVESGTITSIRFDNAEQGSVVTAPATTWATSDGGKSWSKH